MGRELAHAGINVNFGPVVDLNVNPRNPVINRLKRSFGSDPEAVIDFARAFIIAHREANVVTAAKHFRAAAQASPTATRCSPTSRRADGRIPRARVEEAYGRMLLLKRRLMQHDLEGDGSGTRGQ
jgi:hypothetical protein